MDKKKNVLMIFSDQQRWDTMGCYGQKLDVTPNLDELARRGTKFNLAYTCQPVCGPARSSLQTGLFPTQLGCFTNGRGLPQDTKTIAQYFNENGYETAYVGKWHLASTAKELSEDRIGMDYETSAIPEHLRGGYKDYWIASDVLEFTSHGYGGYLFDKDNNRVEFGGYRADGITDFALQYLQKPKDSPFFMFISYIEPHHQNDRGRYEGPEGSKEKFKDFDVPGDLKGKDGDYMSQYPDYLGCCNSIDYNVGRIIDTLKENGTLDDTVIIYTSDHGSHFKTRNSEYKRACHEGCTHIPMIAYGGDFTNAGEVDELVSLIDLPRTFLEAADITPSHEMQGTALQKLVREPGQPIHSSVYMQISESQVGRAIRTKKWKYSVHAKDADPWYNASGDEYESDFLYDLENDLYENNNLAKYESMADVRRKLAQELKAWMKAAKEDEARIIN